MKLFRAGASQKYKNLIHKLIVTAVAVTFVVSSAAPVGATSLSEQIRQLQSLANQQQADATAKHNVANDYKGKVAELQAQIEALQTQIALNQTKYDKTTQDIDQAKEDLVKQKNILNENIRTIYQQGNVSSLEMLASSDNFSDYVNQQEYSQKVKDKVTSSLESIKKLKAQLEQQQAELTAILMDQKNKKQELAANQAQTNQLLALANQDASAADAQVRSTNAQVAQLKAQQAAILQSSSNTYNGSIPGASGGSGGACDNGHGNGGYPMQWCNAPQDYFTTPWGYSRECVSWAGWRRSQMGRPVYGWGNANQWDDGARASGYSVNSSPEVGAVAQTDAGFYGHVAVVEAIQGGSVVVSEMNYDNAGHYRMSVYPASYFRYIH